MAIMYVAQIRILFTLLGLSTLITWILFLSSFIYSLFSNNLGQNTHAHTHTQSGSCDSLFSKHDTRFTNSGESLSEGFGTSIDDDDPNSRFSNGNIRQPQVPPLITACIDHLTNYGLHVVGIFRVSTSKRRIREVKEKNIICTQTFAMWKIFVYWKWFFSILFRAHRTQINSYVKSLIVVH